MGAHGGHEGGDGARLKIDLGSSAALAGHLRRTREESKGGRCVREGSQGRESSVREGTRRRKKKTRQRMMFWGGSEWRTRLGSAGDAPLERHGSLGGL